MYNHYLTESESESESGTDSETEIQQMPTAIQSKPVPNQHAHAQDAFNQWRTTFQQSLQEAQESESESDSETELEQETNTTKIVQHPTPTTQKRVTTVIMVDSLDRDKTVYPLPTDIRIKLPRTYKHIERIDIVQVKFFCGLYAISDTLKNNVFVLTDASGTNTCTLMNGTYSIQELLASMEGLITSSPLSAPGYSLSFNPVSGRVTIAGLAPFSLQLSNLGWMLGFSLSQSDVSGSGSYTASAWPRLSGPDYIFLQLNDTEHMNGIDHTSVENVDLNQENPVGHVLHYFGDNFFTGQVSHYFGKLLMNSFGCWAQTFIESPKVFSPELGRLERLQFTWMDRNGQKLTGADALSCDWHMTLRITEVVDVSTIP
jgi:hypothetical protein